jgi:hypothetical protein
VVDAVLKASEAKADEQFPAPLIHQLFRNFEVQAA